MAQLLTENHLSGGIFPTCNSGFFFFSPRQLETATVDHFEVLPVIGKQLQLICEFLRSKLLSSGQIISQKERKINN